MRIILYNKMTGDVLGQITANHSMMVDDVSALLQVKVMKTKEDYERNNGVDFEELDIIEDRVISMFDEETGEYYTTLCVKESEEC